jgi:small neutral amino acid transporter SnatA (MarC family)
MNPKKYLEDLIRGWLPKEPSFQNPQKTKMVEVNQTKKPTKTELAMFCIGIIAIMFITLTILEALGLPYSSPFVAGGVGVLAAAVSSVLFLKPRSQSSKHSKDEQIELKQ